MADIREMEAAYSQVATSLITTAETVVVTCGPVRMPADIERVMVLAWGQLLTVATTTTVTPRIRRGALITDPLVGLAVAEAIKAAAGSIEPFMLMVVETIPARDGVVYSLTLQMAGAATNGTMQQACIAVFAL